MRLLILTIICVKFLFVSAISQEISKDKFLKKSPDDSAEHQISLEKAFHLLEKKYDVYFIYENQIISGLKTPAIKEFSGNVFDDLQKILKKHHLQYSLVGKKTFVILRKPVSKTTFGKIRGFVTDGDGNPLPGAEVMLINAKLLDIADNKGAYIFDGLQKGEYLVSAQMIGYKTKSFLVKVTPGEIVDQNFFLESDILDMEEIVTVACRNPFMKLESSVAITTANSKQIAERAPQSTADLLKVIPGFYVESSGGEVSNNLFPRGIPQDGSYRYVAMYEDGLPIFEAPELAFANIDIMMRLDESVKSMEGVRGGTSSIYASNAPGGVINFISKTGGNKREIIIKLSAGSNDFRRLDFNYGGPASEKIKFNVGGFLRYSKGIRSAHFTGNSGGQIKLNMTRLFKKGYFRIYGKYLNDRNIFYLPIPLQNPNDPESIPGLNANYGTITSVHAGKSSFPSPYGKVYQRDIRDGIHPELMSVTLEYVYDFGQGWSIQNNLRVMKTDIEFNAIFPLETPFNASFFADSVKHLSDNPEVARWEYRYANNGAPIENISNLNNNGLIALNGWWTISKPLKNLVNNLQINKKFGKHKVSFAGYFSKYSAGDFWYWQNILTEVKDAPRLLDLVGLNSSGEVVHSVTQNGFEQYGSFYVNAMSNATVYSTYFTDEWQATEKLRLDTGMRLESHHFKGKVENTRDDFIIGDGKTEAERNVVFGDGTFRYYKHKFNEWAFSFGGNYSINRHLALYGRLSRGFRTPDFEQWIFSEDKGKSQYIYQMEGGLKVASPQFSLFSSVFFSHINNIPFIDEVFKNGRIIHEKRFAKSRTVGVEFEAVFIPTSGLHLNLIGTIQDPRLLQLLSNKIDPKTGAVTYKNLSGNRVRRIPQFIIDFRPSYNYKGFNIFYSWQYIGDRFVDDANTAVLPGYNLISAGASYKLLKNKVRLGLNISNLTNTLGLTEGNPRIEQEFANRRQNVFMARPILGRFVNLSLTLRL
ncbi:MAG: TonB-dependent receptor [Calditrichaeota bacterium]|nr:TonB-dependent receptor [Calditrichota bacterium]